ncbi:L,D-transpeptidase family protein [Aestuariivirga sp.]|uniref:L,D-transpeptidase family protein n=1 Tax=Aestuariivirga sp. TaxID=2650926 RepID=UPI0025C5C2C8|nr:L,D-transpeptidase family protein [Aestuariivirga sp.]MCA3556340.1 L,D-transpeptidase family protein [Aestuariivirga sp.]
MRMATRVLIAILLWAGLAAAAHARPSTAAPPAAAVQAAIAAVLNDPERLPLPLERIRPALIAHYIRDQGPVYWVGTGRMTPFLQRLADAGDDGLNPTDYPIDALIQLRDTIDPVDADSAALAELFFTAFFVNYATDLKIGRLTPTKVDPKNYRNRKTVDVLAIMTGFSKQNDPGDFLDAFESHNPHYQALKKILALYRAMSESVDWDSIPMGADIKPGDSDPRIPDIREKLMLTGDHPGGEADQGDVYDSSTALAVRSFQLRNGLEPRGIIGKQTILALNVPPAGRARQVMLNMERWRWMPEDLGAHHYMVNLAAFELSEVRNEDIVDRMDVVVGAVATQTPEFSDELEYVEINPTWTVPYSIATGEMLPKLRRNPSAYAGDFEVFMNGKLASWGGINWNAYGKGNFPFTFRQKPGPRNALGKVKFMLPNPYNIYLHDTPAKDKFLAITRAFSHGCIRLSRPMDLAYHLVGGIAGWPKPKIDQAFASGQTTRVRLPRNIPVHLIYATAFEGDGGSIEFRPDIYGRDRKLGAALSGKPSS